MVFMNLIRFAHNILYDNYPPISADQVLLLERKLVHLLAPVPRRFEKRLQRLGCADATPVHRDDNLRLKRYGELVRLGAREHTLAAHRYEEDVYLVNALSR